MPGRILAIGDVHGCDAALGTLIDQLAIVPEDTVILLGDLCDRGPDTKGVIDRLMELSGRCDFRLILGNHDEMMLGAFGRGPNVDPRFWDGVGGRETLASYGGADRVPDEHLAFLETARLYIETDSDIFIHATLEPGIPLRGQDGDYLRWLKITGDEPPHRSGKRIVCGHTSQPSGKPLLWDGWICIDTRVYETGWLTALDAGSNLIYQAHQSGQTREPLPVAEFQV